MTKTISGISHLVLIDGHSLAYRMYFALERTGMKTSGQIPTWGVYGFFKALFDVVKQVQPDGMAIAFDAGRETFRTRLYPEYKAHRQAMPDSLREQLVQIRRGVELLGIPVFEIPDFEADDVIGTLARQAAEQQADVTILTGDQDAFQVIDAENRISLLVPGFSGGLTRYDRHKVFEKWGVTPEQVTDFKGLKGDTSDNIPGVPGIGDKTAAKLLSEYQSLEEVLANATVVSGKKLRESLIQYREQAILSKELATIRFDAPVTFSDDACRLHMGSPEPFLDFLKTMEFRSMLAQSATLLKPFLPNDSEAVSSDTPPVTLDEASTTIQEELQHSETGDLFQGALDFSQSHFSPPHTIIETEAALNQLIEKLTQAKVFAIDIETTSLDVLTSDFAGIALGVASGFTLEDRSPQNILQLKNYPKQLKTLAYNGSEKPDIDVFYIPIQHPENERCLDKTLVLSKLAPVLADETLVKIAHNAKFEINTFRQHGITFKGLVVDTMVMSYVLDSNRRHGLKALSYDLLGILMQEITALIGTGKKQKPFTEVPLDDAAPYATCDAYCTLALAARFIRQLDTGLSTLFYEIELPLVQVLADMEYTGVSLDTAYLSSLSTMLDGQIKTVEAEIYELAGTPFNLNSPKQVGEVFFDKLKIPAKGMTKSKTAFSTNAKVLETLAPDYPIVQKLLDYRQLFKLKSTYIDALPTLINPKDGRLHTSFNQAVTATGRLSSSDPNLQNIPIRSDIGRSIRKGFVTANQEERFILSADYSQIELRLLAHFSEDDNLLAAFNSGEDIHKATAALVFDVPLEAVTKEMRYQAKAVNFGIIYGQTAFGLSNALGIFPKEAAEFIDKYFARYPKVKGFIDSVKAEAHQTGKVYTLCGRMRDLSEGLNTANRGIREFSERAAFNTPLQGSASDLIKVAMIRLNDALKRDNLGSKIILQVHDEVVLEVLNSERETVRELVLWAMTLDQPLKVPLVVDMAEGPTWLEAD